VRRVEDITEALWGTRVSPSTVSNLNKKIYASIEMWIKNQIFKFCETLRASPVAPVRVREAKKSSKVLKWTQIFSAAGFIRGLSCSLCLRPRGDNGRRTGRGCDVRVRARYRKRLSSADAD
jgi:hypothetical protein